MLWKGMLTTLTCVVVLAVAVPAGAEPPQGATAPIGRAEAPIKAEIDTIFGRLGETLHQADALAEHLKQTAGKTPEATKKEVDQAASTLSALADYLQPNGQLAMQLATLRIAALTHRKRVQDLPKGALEESDRTRILAAWDKVVQDADTAATLMASMRDKLLASLQRLRMRQTAVSELVLAGQYQAAVDSLLNWLNDLQGTIDGLQHAIDDAGSVVRPTPAKTS